jgi:hypothetical protein
VSGGYFFLGVFFFPGKLQILFFVIVIPMNLKMRSSTSSSYVNERRPDSVDDKVRKKEMRKGIDLTTTLERIEKNFFITDPRLPENPIVRFLLISFPLFPDYRTGENRGFFMQTQKLTQFYREVGIRVQRCRKQLELRRRCSG